MLASTQMTQEMGLMMHSWVRASPTIEAVDPIADQMAFKHLEAYGEHKKSTKMIARSGFELDGFGEIQWAIGGFQEHTVLLKSQ